MVIQNGYVDIVDLRIIVERCVSLGRRHDVEKVFSCPTVHYGIEESLEGDRDGLCVCVCVWGILNSKKQANYVVSSLYTSQICVIFFFLRRNCNEKREIKTV